MRTFAVILVAVSLVGCATLFDFLDAHGRDVANTVLECVPLAGDPTPAQAAACFDAARGALESAASPERGERVVECAHALREAERARELGDERSAVLAEKRVKLLIEALE